MFLITIIRSGNSGSEIERNLISDYTEAKNFFDQQKGYLIQETVDDNGLSEEEKMNYIEEIITDYSVNDYLDSAIDPDNEWSIYLEKVDQQEENEPSVTRLEILLMNAIDLLVNEGYEDWQIKEELGLNDEEFEKYYPKEEK